MAAVDSSRTVLADQSVGGRLNLFVAGVLANFRAWNDARATRKALLRLTDRELDDIGLSRADIDNVVATLAK